MAIRFHDSRGRRQDGVIGFQDLAVGERDADAADRSTVMARTGVRVSTRAAPTAVDELLASC